MTPPPRGPSDEQYRDHPKDHPTDQANPDSSLLLGRGQPKSPAPPVLGNPRSEAEGGGSPTEHSEGGSAVAGAAGEDTDRTNNPPSRARARPTGVYYR